MLKRQNQGGRGGADQAPAPGRDKSLLVAPRQAQSSGINPSLVSSLSKAGALVQTEKSLGGL